MRRGAACPPSPPPSLAAVATTSPGWWEPGWEALSPVFAGTARPRQLRPSWQGSRRTGAASPALPGQAVSWRTGASPGMAGSPISCLASRSLARHTDALLTTPLASSPHAALCRTEGTLGVGLRWQSNRASEPRARISPKPAATSTFLLPQQNLAEMCPTFMDHSSCSLPLPLHVIFAPATMLTGCVLARWHTMKGTWRFKAHALSQALGTALHGIPFLGSASKGFFWIAVTGIG